MAIRSLFFLTNPRGASAKWATVLVAHAILQFHSTLMMPHWQVGFLNAQWQNGAKGLSDDGGQL